MSPESLPSAAESPDGRAAEDGKDARQNAFPVSWKDWTDDSPTKGIISGLVEELRVSVRLTGERVAVPPIYPSDGLPVGKKVAKRGGRRPDPLAYEDVIFRLLLNLFRVADVDPSAWLGYSRTRGDYSDLSAYPQNVSYFRVRRVVDWLTSVGWVDSEPGYYDWNQGYGWQSLLRASPRLRERFAGFSPRVTQAPFTDRELIRLKDDEKERITEYEETPQLAVWRDKLRRINQQIASSKLGFCLGLEQMQAMVADLRSRQSCPDLSRIQLYRSFNVSWDRGGRFYGGWWINLPSEYRRFITIDDEPTEELDFSSFHISMIYGLESLAIPEGDLYDIGWPERYRPMVKKFVNALLYADKGEDAAIKAMQDFREDSIKMLWKQFDDDVTVIERGRNSGLLAPMLAAIKQKHSLVADRFGKGDSTRLQAKDAEIAELILMASVFQQITALPIHDSFIVPATQSSNFKSLMEKTFYAHFAQTVGVKSK